jgi:hypothetical protein
MPSNRLRDVNIIRSSVTYVAGDQTNIQNATQGVKPLGRSWRFVKLNKLLILLDAYLPYAASAAFEYLDSTDMSRCLEGTREDVLRQIHHWIDGDDAQIREKDHQGNTDVGETPRIFWINGSAGTGKTTIAYTVAEACRARKTLGATFFCSRYSADRSNPDLIFTTIAHQLGLFFTPFKVEISRALKSHPDIGSSSVPYQLEELIVKPLHSVRNSFPSCLVILDALDECKDNRITSIILSSLSRHVAELSPLKFLITSRPEQNITSAFKLSSQLIPLSHPLFLHEIELGIVQQDIERYLTSSFSRIRELYYLDSSWPSTSDTRALAELSNGLFIFAATSINFIQDRNYSSPADQLESLLTNPPNIAQSSLSPHRRLDELYTQVLSHAFPNIAPPLADRLKIVLGSIIFLRDPLSSRALEELLKLKPTTVRQTLVHLHSVVIVPEDHFQVIRLLHPSFFDFVTDPSRCRQADFVVNPLIQHALLARACLDSMMCLRQDICGIKNSCLLNSEVDDLPARITKYIPPHVQYACRHWAFHLTNASVSNVLMDLMKEFCSKRLLYWVEVCSLLGELRNALIALNGVRQSLLVSCLLV